jgi:hypothetical protein
MLLTAILVVTLVLLIRPEMLQVDIGYFSMVFTGMSKDLKIMISGIRGNTLIIVVVPIRYIQQFTGPVF